MPIYTKKGDRGETGLPGGRRLSKTDPIFSFLGSLDQTNSILGLAISYLDEKSDISFRNDLQEVQASLFEIGACLASVEPSAQIILNKLPKLTTELEKSIDLWGEAMPELKNFILPGGSKTSAYLHLARTLIRQAERDFHRLNTTGLEQIAIYLNRLSDFFFQAARFNNFGQKIEETIWQPKK